MKPWDTRLRSGSGGGADLVSTWMRQGLIRSVQAVTIAVAGAPNTAAISAVTVANSILLHMGSSVTDVPTAARESVRLALTSSILVTATVAVVSATVQAVVLEFVPGVLRTVQTGTIATDATSTSTLPIAVDTQKAFALHLGTSGSVGDATPVSQSRTRVVLTNSTTVTATVTTVGGVLVTGFMVPEFY